MEKLEKYGLAVLILWMAILTAFVVLARSEQERFSGKCHQVGGLTLSAKNGKLVCVREDAILMVLR